MATTREDLSDWGARLLAFLEHLLKILRGVPQHRLASLAVAGGLLIMAGPFWEPYLRAFAEQRLGLRIDLPADPKFGLALVALGLLYHFGMAWLSKREAVEVAAVGAQTNVRIREHDAPIFAAFLEAAPERKFRYALSNTRDSHSLYSSQKNILLNALDFLEQANHHFNDPELAQTSRDLRTALVVFADFFAMHFYVHGPMRDDALFAMAPHWNIDRGGNPTLEQSRQYSELAREVLAKTGAIDDAYVALIAAAHQRVL